MKLAAQLTIEEALEGDVREQLGREYYAPGEALGNRNGYRTGKLDAAEGRIDYAVPQVRGLEGWRSAAHRRAIRTTNVLERLFGEERRRTKVIPHAIGERALLKLMYAALIRAGQTWQRVAINEFERRQIVDLRNELDETFEEQTASNPTTASGRRFSSKSET